VGVGVVVVVRSGLVGGWDGMGGERRGEDGVRLLRKAIHELRDFLGGADRRAE
jgi:hypothetical protein